MEAAHIKVSSSFAKKLVDEYQPATYRSHYAIEANTRYFTEIKGDAEGIEFVDFADGVDPHGSLARLVGDRYAHTLDNRVDYLQVTTNEAKKTR